MRESKTRGRAYGAVDNRNLPFYHERKGNDSEKKCPAGSGRRYPFGEQTLLFRYLNDDAFLAFSRDHKDLYAACLLDLYERFFTGAPAFPTPQEVTHAIYEIMRCNPTLWNEGDDFGDPLPEVISAG